MFKVLSESRGINPALVAAAFRIEKLASVLMILPIEFPTIGAGAMGVGSGTSLLQDVAITITSKALKVFTSQFFI